MQSFMRLAPFQAISFDLDDTLYNNKPIMAAAEDALLAWLAEHYPLAANWSRDDWRQLKKQVLSAQPQLVHDTSATRLAVLQHGLGVLGYSARLAAEGAEAGLGYFASQRSHFRVADGVLALLAQLAERWPLIGITNGNVNEQAIGLGDVLAVVLHPGNGIRMKPYPDLFALAAQRLAIAPSQLLHVGDHPLTDVQGARLAGCQAVWLNPGYGRTTPKHSGPLLPHLQISAITQLQQLL
ncbi:HAD-IA family hydrolase [Shewanella sp. YIC-542]|uniref:HAD-IA family hydrolase n=1 Tax=Shewanella mytili TaxID=3377111 RepID=UPI00398E4CB4